MNKATSAHLYPIYLHSTSDRKAQSRDRQTTIVITAPMEHIQDPVDEPPTPFKGRNPQRGRAVERKTRRSKRGDHGLATRHLVRRLNQGSWKQQGKETLSSPPAIRQLPIDDGSHHRTTYSPETPQSLHLHTNPRSYAAEMTISSSMQSEPPLKAHPASHVPLSNAVQGEETLQGDSEK